jgi:hypothetical protein
MLPSAVSECNVTTLFPSTPCAGLPDRCWLWFPTDTSPPRLVAVAEGKQRYCRPRVLGFGLVEEYSSTPDASKEGNITCKQLAQLCGQMGVRCGCT